MVFTHNPNNTRPHKKTLLEQFDSIFSTNEASFIGWFAIFFLGSAILLSAFGFLPSELQEESDGTNFVQSAEQSALGIFNGTNSNNFSAENQAQQISLPLSNTTVKSGFSNGKFGVKGSASGVNTNTGISSTNNTKNPIEQGIIPDRLLIPSINVNTIVRNPVSADISKLDYELTKGAVRYPGSGTVGKGNMFIFGHSTGFQVVINKAYKVFNDLHTLTKGDQILLQSGSATFVYTVSSVQKVNKNSTEIKFDSTGNMLTISTCDSFGAKTDRYIVEATYVGQK